MRARIVPKINKAVSCSDREGASIGPWNGPIWI
jgi:hypothetical protein